MKNYTHKEPLGKFLGHECFMSFEFYNKNYINKNDSYDKHKTMREDIEKKLLELKLFEKEI